MGWHTREELRLDAQKRAKQKNADERLIANLRILNLKSKCAEMLLFFKKFKLHATLDSQLMCLQK